jgi:hypothetical protein
LQGQISQYDEPLLTASRDSLLKAQALRADLMRNVARLGELDIKVSALEKYRVLDGADFIMLSKKADLVSRLQALSASISAVHERIHSTRGKVAFAESAWNFIEPLQSLRAGSAALTSLKQCRDKIAVLPPMQVLSSRLEFATFCAQSLERVSYLGAVANTVSLVNAGLTGVEYRTRSLGAMKRRVLLSDRIATGILPALSLYMKRAPLVSKINVSQVAVSALDAELASYKTELLTVTRCPVCGSSLEHSLDHYLGGLT